MHKGHWYASLFWSKYGCGQLGVPETEGCPVQAGSHLCPEPSKAPAPMTLKRNQHVGKLFSYMFILILNVCQLTFISRFDGRSVWVFIEKFDDVFVTRNML